MALKIHVFVLSDLKNHQDFILAVLITNIVQVGITLPC
jgi:hypothetical protein